MDIAMLLFPGMTALDFIGPHEVFRGLPGVRIHRVAAKAGPILSDSGVTLLADHPLDAVQKADILFAPGALDVSAAAKHPQTLEWFRRLNETSRWTSSVCTGSLILGAAGLLRGVRATTHWSAMNSLADLGATPVAERVVEDGKFITGAGVSAGIDMALTLAARIAGEPVAQAIQLGIEYDPDPPFQAGSPKTAPPEVLAAVTARLSGNTEEASS